MSRAWFYGLAACVAAAGISGCAGSPPPISLSLSPSSTQAIDEGQTVAIAAKVTSGGISWRLTGPGTLSSTTRSSISYLSPSTAVTSQQQAVVTATSTADPTQTASLSINVNPLPQIPIQQTLATGTAGASYSQPIEVLGGTPPYQWSIYNGAILTGSSVGGSLPNGLTLNPETGIISGTPAGGGTWYFEAALTDATGVSATGDAVSIQINPAAVAAVTLLGNGDGTFTSAPGSPTSFPSPPYDDFASPYVGSLAVGDFNHSGHIGIAVGLFNNEAADILFGNGDGTFSYSGTPANTEGLPLTSLTAADFNRDGALDLVAINSISGESPVTLLGYNDGAFNGSAPDDGTTGSSAAAGDFNSDGKLDLVIGGASLLLGNGDGTFGSATTLDPNGSFVAVADFNGDGNLDLAICDYTEGTVTILLGDGKGNFSPASNSPILVGHEPSAIVAADFNNDGKLDLAIANYADNTVTLLRGNGDGTFTPSSGSPYTVGSEPSSIAVADFNGDGKLDLAVANGNTVSILLQQ